MKLKEYYGQECAKLIGEKLKKINSQFDREAFIDYIDRHIEGKEFLQRQDMFVDGKTYRKIGWNTYDKLHRYCGCRIKWL